MRVTPHLAVGVTVVKTYTPMPGWMLVEVDDGPSLWVAHEDVTLLAP